MADGGKFEDANGKPVKVKDTKFVERMQAKAATTKNMGVLIGLLSALAAVQIKSKM